MSVFLLPPRPEDIMHWTSPFRPDELYHHGILGQKWGDRHGPPYPLDTKTSVKISKKGNAARQKRYKDRQDKIKSGKLKRKAKDNTGMSMFMEQSHDNNWQEVEARSTAAEREAGTYHYSTPAKVAKDFMNDRGIIPPGYEATWKVHENNGDLTEEALRHVNENFHVDGAGTTNNCMKCTAALALQELGYGLMAGRCSYGINNQAFEYWWDGAEHSSASTDDTDQKLSTFGPGAYGKVGINYSSKNDDGSSVRTGGHAVFFKVNDDGKVKYYDGQTGEPQIFSSYKDLVSANGADPDYDSTITRLDKGTPNWDHLGEDGVIRTRVGKVRNKNDNRIVDTW